MALRNPVIASALFRGLVEHTVVGMLALEESSEGLRLVFVNTHALENLEMAQDTKLRIEDLFPVLSSAGSVTPFSRELLSHDALTPEVMMRKANGHHFLASVGVRRVEIENRMMVLVSFRDITIERKLARDLQAKQLEIERAYAELMEQNDQLKQLDLAKDKFIALTTHELRTPVAAIVATADVLELKLYESENQRDDFIHTISEQGRHLLTLINDVLDFAKIRLGKMEFFVEQIELANFLKKISSNFSHLAVAENIQIVLEEVDSSSTQVWADSLRLKEILHNVVSNAIKFNRTNGEVRIRTKLIATPEGRNFARVSVSDTGVGIAPDKLATVFNEFETSGHASRHHKGTGLGMPIARRLIESMGGFLTFASEVGVGSVFHIDIPTEKVLSDDMYRSRPTDETDFAA